MPDYLADMTSARLALAALFALPATGPGATAAQPDSCPPTAPTPAVPSAEVRPGRLAGRYTLTLVSTWPLRQDTIASGVLELWIDTLPPPTEAPLPPGVPQIPAPPYPRPSLIGATTAPTWRLKALSRVRPDSREAGAPGLRLIDTAFVLGACPDRAYCEDRPTTDLVITVLTRSGFRGYWALRPSAYPPAGVDSAGWPRGYFCAVRSR